MVQLIEKRNTNYMPLFVLGSVGLQLVILVILFLQAGALSRLSRQAPPTLVQMQDGQAVRVAAMDAQDRSPETIRRFVNDTLVLMFNWSGSLPATTAEEASQPKADPGLAIEGERGKQKVATASWQASFAFSEEGSQTTRANHTSGRYDNKDYQKCQKGACSNYQLQIGRAHV